MSSRTGNEPDQLELQRRLLAALSDDLSLPLLQIRTTIESLKRPGVKADLLEARTRSLASHVETGLQLVEAYRLALRASDGAQLQLEPVTISSVLNDVAQELDPYAKQYATKLEVDVTGRLSPVLANKATLSAAMQCLGASIIRAQAAQSRRKGYRVLLAAHRAPDNLITTGVFSNTEGLTDHALRSARGLVGKARQPIPALPAGSASGVLIADMLCAVMWQPLRQAAHRQLHGLATVVPVTSQLRFVG